MNRVAFGLGLAALPLGALAAARRGRRNALVTLPDGLRFVDFKVGTGASPRRGQSVTVTYVGTLANGKQFDASADHGGTFSFPLGEGRVIRGWDEGVATMRIGGRRKLIVPPQLGYGATGAGGVIPPNATLTFVIELLTIGS